MNGNQWVVGFCESCAGKLEFDQINSGTTIQCPHCRKDTVLVYSSSGTVRQPSPSSSALKAALGIEHKVESAARMVLLIGVVIAVLLACLAVPDVDVKWLVLALLVVFQSWVISVVLKGFAEIIRLLRK